MGKIKFKSVYLINEKVIKANCKNQRKKSVAALPNEYLRTGRKSNLKNILTKKAVAMQTHFHTIHTSTTELFIVCNIPHKFHRHVLRHRLQRGNIHGR